MAHAFAQLEVTDDHHHLNAELEQRHKDLAEVDGDAAASATAEEHVLENTTDDVDAQSADDGPVGKLQDDFALGLDESIVVAHVSDHNED